VDPKATITGLPAPENAATYRAAEAAAASPAQRAATDERVEAARAGLPAAGTDTEHLRDTGPGPITQHGAEGISAAGTPVHRPNQRPVDPVALTPLRLLFQIEPFGLPIQFWIGSVLMLGILVLMFL
jgi:hypothetical protein